MFGMSASPILPPVNEFNQKSRSSELHMKMRTEYDPAGHASPRQLTFAVGAALTLEAASTAARQRSAVIPIELIGLNLELLGLAGAAPGVGMPSLVRMEEAEFWTAAVTLRVVAVAAVPQLLPQQSLSDIH